MRQTDEYIANVKDVFETMTDHYSKMSYENINNHVCSVHKKEN